MKRIYIFFLGAVLIGSIVMAGEEAPAVLERKDGKALRVFLQNCISSNLIVRLDAASSDTQIKLDSINQLQFSHVKYDEKAVRQYFNQADYAAVIAALEPIVTPYRNYVFISNNLETVFCLLMNAQLEKGNFLQAKDISDRLLANENPAVQLAAQVGRALVAIGENDQLTAETMLSKIQQPAAKLYVQACIERSKNQPKVAIQTAVNLIARYPNDMDWLPQTELLCAELYNEMGLPNSAISTARQTEKIYTGMNVEKEAQALRLRIENTTAKPE